MRGLPDFTFCGNFPIPNVFTRSADLSIRYCSAFAEIHQVRTQCISLLSVIPVDLTDANAVSALLITWLESPSIAVPVIPHPLGNDFHLVFTDQLDEALIATVIQKVKLEHVPQLCPPSGISAPWSTHEPFQSA